MLVILQGSTQVLVYPQHEFILQKKHALPKIAGNTTDIREPGGQMNVNKLSEWEEQD